MAERTMKDILIWALELLPENRNGRPYTYYGYPVDLDCLDELISGYVVQKCKKTGGK